MRSRSTVSFWGDGTSAPEGPGSIRALITTTPTLALWAASTCDFDLVARPLCHRRRRHRQQRGEAGRSAVSASRVSQADPLWAGRRMCASAAATSWARWKWRSCHGLCSMSGFSGTQNNAAMGGFVPPGGARWSTNPTLNDLGTPKRNVLARDRQHLWRRWRASRKRTHHPARPEDKFVLYRSITCTGQLVARQLNSSGVFDIA